MKKLLLTFFLTVMVTVTLQAQQISVVSSGGATKLYNTLKEAIEGASDGSVIYLPGGGFQISDDVKIKKKLTIIGIGHKAKTDNVDGNTTIAGNLFFDEGSSGSAVMGCFITGTVHIGNKNIEVNDVLIRYCNLDHIYAYSQCKGTVVNQNYIRNGSELLGTAIITNNVLLAISNLRGGIISNNIITRNTNYPWPLTSIENTTITNNIFLMLSNNNLQYCSNNSVSGNMIFRITYDNDGIHEDHDVIYLTELLPNDVFEKYNNGAISPSSDFHFKAAYKQYENQVGIYAGTGFNDNQMAPVPYIVAKDIPEQTDASGKLNIKIRVKAGE